MKKILITGSNGFIGRQLCTALAKEYEIFGINRTQSAQLDEQHGFICELSDFTSIHTIFDRIQPDIVIHLAALVHKNHADTSQANYDFINYECACNIFDECIQRNCKLIFSSTIEVYVNRQQTLVKESTVCSPKSYYAIAKYKAEEYLRTHSDQLTYAILQFAPVYGEAFTLNIDKRILLKPIPLAYYFKNGEYQFHFCSVNNIITFVTFLIEKDAYGNTIYNLSDKKAVSAKELITFYKAQGWCKYHIRMPYLLCEAMILFLGVFYKVMKKKDVFLSIRNFEKLFSSTIYSNQKADTLCPLPGSIEDIVKGRKS